MVDLDAIDALLAAAERGYTRGYIGVAKRARSEAELYKALRANARAMIAELRRLRAQVKAAVEPCTMPDDDTEIEGEQVLVPVAEWHRIEEILKDYAIGKKGGV